MPNPSDAPHEIRSHAKAVSATQAHTAATRTIINVLLTPEVETNADVMACAVEAIHALPYVADVTTRKVRARPLPTQRERTP